MSRRRTPVIRQPVAPAVFLRRATRAEAMLACIQLFHLLVLSEASFADLVTWLIVHCLAQAALAVLRHAARDSRRYVDLAWRPLVALMALTLAFKFASRLPYVESWLAEGLLATRSNEELAGGGWTSAFNVFFYPLAILLVFCTMPRRPYRWLFLGVLIICAIDLVALGTRNAPMFVLMFHFLAAPFRLRARHLPVLAAVLALFVAVFGYSTSHRTQESELDRFDWLVLFEFTSSAQMLKINETVVRPLEEKAPAVLPAVFLSHYLSHSIAELDYVLERAGSLQLGEAYYLQDQFCAVGICDRDLSLARIEVANPRPGVYQTLWASLLLDFDWLGTITLTVGGIALLYSLQRLHAGELGIGMALAIVILMLSPIENYFYNALGLVQTLAIVVMQEVLRCRYIGQRLSAPPYGADSSLLAQG